MKKQWNYVEKDGNPKEPGTYWVTLIYPEWKDNKKTEIGRASCRERV